MAAAGSACPKAASRKPFPAKATSPPAAPTSRPGAPITCGSAPERAARARVARSTDAGLTWSIVDTPLRAGPTEGIYSIAFRDADNGVVVGGDYRLEDDAVENAAYTEDGGRSWHPPERGLSGYRSAVGFVGDGSTTIAIGPTGADVSLDGGRTWAPANTPAGMHTLAIAPGSGTVWAAGNAGQVVGLRGPFGR